MERVIIFNHFTGVFMSDEINSEIITDLLKDYKEPSDLLGTNGLLKKLTKALVEKALEGEMNSHLGYKKHEVMGNNSGNSRNGTTKKRLRSNDGPLEITIPRDRNNEFEPLMVPKHHRHFNGFDEKILALYALGTSTRDIKEHLREIYGVEVSADFISSVTEQVLAEVKEWQERALESIYPIVYLDALVVKIKENGHVQNRAVNLAIGVSIEGERDILGMWICKNEGAKFWLQVISELKNRGVEDVFIVCVDGLKGLAEAIEAIFPKAEVQTCIIHMVRNSLKYVSYKERKRIANLLKNIYHALNEEDALEALEVLKSELRESYPQIGKSWQNNWSRVSVIFNYPQEIRKIIYTTNAIESLNNFIRKVIKNKRIFPNENSARKLIYLAIRNKLKRWTAKVKNWNIIMKQFAIIFEERLNILK